MTYQGAMMNQVDVTIVMATYNHAPFVEEAIRSVLSQKGVEFEFLIADDGSKDGTPERVARIDDARIRFTAHRANRGAGVVVDELIGQAVGRYVALINSDDRWVGEFKLMEQFEFLENHPNFAASFGRARYIDQHGLPIAKSELPFGGIFDEHNRSQGQWLRRFFDFGNCLLHPSLLIRRSCYDELGLYDNRFRQLPDFDMWVKLVKRYEIHVSDKEYVDFRILPGENASAHTDQNRIRVINEHHLIAKHFFDDVSLTQLQDGFADQITAAAALPGCLEIEKALLLLGERGTFNRDLLSAYRLVAIDKLFELLGQSESRALMAEHYGINDLWLHKLLAETPVLTYKAPKVKRRKAIAAALKTWVHRVRGFD